ncbi:hypothetical protein C8F01DRAFT_1120649, partial [Mycena amicta]
PAKPVPSTCSRCRAKKINCDGQQPCTPCCRARIDDDCSYTVVPNLSHGPELRKGAACTACRSDILKCSGDWPCRTCIASKREDECKFDDNSQLSYTRALIERTLELEQLLSRAKQAPQPEPAFPLGANVTAEPDQFDSNAMASTSAVTLSSTDDTDVDYSYDAESPTPSLPPASETHEERMLRLLQFGFVLSAHKLRAVMLGDMSASVVHPVLVHVCHLWGAMLDYCETNQTWTYATGKHGDEVRHMQLVLGCIAGMLGPPPDAATMLMAYLSLSLYFFHKQDFGRGQDFLELACDTALCNNMDMAVLASTPINDRGAGQGGMYSLLPLTEADELRSVYSKLIWVALSSKIVLGTPYEIDQRLLAAFERLVPTQLQNNADINFQRAKSNMLLRRTRQLTTSFNVQAASAAWFQEYWKLIEQLYGYIGLLNPVQLRLSFVPESRTTGIVLKLCSTVALTSLADLHGVFAPSRKESSKRYRDAVLEIASISSTFTIEDSCYLDPILPVCWAVATKRVLENTVVYENRESLMEAIRSRNDDLIRYVALVAELRGI